MFRRPVIGAAVFLVFTLVVAPAAFAQQPEQEPKSIEGSLKTIDLEEKKIVVTQSDESEVTLVLTEETKIHSSEGEMTVAALEGKEGTALRASFVQNDDGNVALMIVLVTD